MKLVLRLVAILALASLPATAQQYEDTRVKVFAGYSIMPTTNLGKDFVAAATEKQGFTGSAALRIARGFSAKFDFTNVNAPGNVKLFMVGPEYRVVRYNHLEIFAHGLIGVVRSRATVGQNAEFPGFYLKDSSVAYAGGAGLDIDFTRHVGWRLLQFDYLHGDQVGALTSNGFRASTGLVVKF